MLKMNHTNIVIETVGTHHAVRIRLQYCRVRMRKILTSLIILTTNVIGGAFVFVEGIIVNVHALPSG